MRYRWDDFSLDREAMLLVHDGRQVDVTRKTLACIHHLIENRHRVVGYDELIRTLWGHDNVTNHQLSQVILSARRAIGDDGHTQRLIRTAPGLGYRWVGAISEGDAPSAQSPEPANGATSKLAQRSMASGVGEGLARSTTEAEASGPRTSEPPASESASPAAPPQDASPAGALVADTLPIHGGRKRAPHWLGWIAVSAVGLSGAAMYGTMRGAPAQSMTSATATPAGDAVATLEAALDAGRYEDVREGLARLPPEIADGPQAKLLEVRLDMLRGRTELALQKLERQQARADAAGDPLWRARVLTMKSMIFAKGEGTPASITAASSEALALLASMGEAAPAEDVSDAVFGRGVGLMREGRSDEAMRDFVRAKDIRIAIGDLDGAAQVHGNLARAWMRAGRMREALEELQALLASNRRSKDPVNQIYTLNTISRIQVELLRWEQALSANDEALRLLRQTPGSDRRQRALVLRAFILSETGRLHEAAAQLEEAAQLEGGDDAISASIEAMHHLASGAPARAMARLEQSFDTKPYTYDFNPMLEDAEGPLLLWALAARDLATQGKPVRDLPVQQKAMIQNARTATGRIARGRWLWMQGDAQAAEADFRWALQETRRMGQTYRMTLAAEALVELLLQRDDADGARIVLEDLRAHQPNRIDRDYRSSVMSLQVAIAGGDPARIRAAYTQVRALAGERALPGDVARRYADATRKSTAAFSRPMDRMVTDPPHLK
ncbi:winged helix-turn-helix domain-containing protein [Lysobacter brunescens]|uniref:Winged helix-turn-helix domain-containing protein n=1 Tax=Lysobacter brunescens TaxID=262323 RepID=A0ABW2Y7S6_9GAMM